MALPILDVLHRGVVYSLMGISAYSIFVGVYGHRERKAALMEKVKANSSGGAPATEMALARAAQGVLPSKRS
ncbi:hypothetical protein C8R44DRAFT_136548 [Mycena epipterygia]|nr:hypothetical protein C8R44DRAFT_136548 [Mycena epipterygia]